MITIPADLNPNPPKLDVHLHQRIFTLTLSLFWAIVVCLHARADDTESFTSALRNKYPNAVVQKGKEGAIISIKLSQTNIDSDAWAILKGFHDLEELVFDRSILDVSSWQEIQGFKKLKRLRLPSSDVSDQSLKTISAISQLELLDLADCQQVTDAGLTHLISLSKLRNLTVGSRRVTGQGLQAICQLTSLGALSLQDCSIDGDGFSHLGKLTKLKEFGLFKSTMGDTALQQLVSCKEITKLKLRASGVTSRGIIQCITSFPKLTSIDLGETSVDDFALESLAQTNLEDVNLLRTSITNRGVESLVGLPLKRLNLDDIRGIDDEVFDSLLCLKSLEFLHLGKTRITDAGLMRLETLGNLKDLIINDTTISPEAIAKLQKANSDLRIKN